MSANTATPGALSCVQLPEDILALVVEYMPLPEKQRLQALSPFILRAALREKYTLVTVNPKGADDLAAEATLQGLQSTFAADFVRAVRIHFEFPPHYLPACLSDDLPGVLACLPRADALLFSLGAGLTPFATAAYVRLLSSTLCSPLGVRLSSLELRLSDAQCAQLGALGAWACRLTTLTLFVDDCGEHASALDKLALSVVLPARETLTALAVHFRVYGWQGSHDSPRHEVRCGAFFAHLEHTQFPLLTDLRVATPFLDAKPRLEETALLSIIRTHALRTLDVSPSWLHLLIRPAAEDVRTYAAGYARFLAALGSPSALPGTLQSLRLMVLPPAEDHLPLVMAVLRSFPHHLDELSLGGCALDDAQLRAVLAAGCTQRLRALRVVPAAFGPDLLDALAAALPDLVSLELLVAGQTSPNKFAARAYPAVRWRHLTLRGRDMAGELLTCALRRALPSLTRVEVLKASSDEGWELETTNVGAIMQRPL